MINLGSTIINSIIGGAIMALAASLHLYLNGKITGISGAIFRCITLTDFSYNFAFITGMIFISSFLKCFFDPMAPPETVDSPIFMETTSKFVGDLSIIGFMLAGFLVGFGAKMANGCTSGHGVCGLPRLSKRSIVAIILFMAFGILMATVRYYLPFLRPSSYAFNVWETSVINIGVLVLSILGLGANLWKSYRSVIQDKVRDILVSFIIGSLFSFGLIQSGMLQRHVVVEFLILGKVWNYQLAFVLATGSITAGPARQPPGQHIPSRMFALKLPFCICINLSLHSFPPFANSLLTSPKPFSLITSNTALATPLDAAKFLP